MIVKLLISPALGSRREKVDAILAQVKLSKNHPDVLYFEEAETLGIEQARKIKEHFSLKPYSAEGRVVVLEDASNLTIDAQNALLKTLEEPPEGSILLLGASSDVSLLPTIISRCQMEYLPARRGGPIGKAEVGEKFYHDIAKLVGQTIEERFEYIEKLENREEFLKALVGYFRNKLHKDPKLLEFTKELLRAEGWNKQNVNIRAILEYLMFKMP